MQKYYFFFKSQVFLQLISWFADAPARGSYRRRGRLRIILNSEPDSQFL